MCWKHLWNATQTAWEINPCSRYVCMCPGVFVGLDGKGKSIGIMWGCRYFTNSTHSWSDQDSTTLLELGRAIFSGSSYLCFLALKLPSHSLRIPATGACFNEWNYLPWFDLELFCLVRFNFCSTLISQQLFPCECLGLQNSLFFKQEYRVPGTVLMLYCSLHRLPMLSYVIIFQRCAPVVVDGFMCSHPWFCLFRLYIFQRNILSPLQDNI